jgi:hypothetical protein
MLKLSSESETQQYKTRKQIMKKIGSVIAAFSIGLAVQAQVIDPLTGSLSGYTTTMVLENSLGAGNGVSFTDSGSGLQANFVGTGSTPEQALFLAPLSYFSTTFAVGDRLTVNLAVPDGPQSGSYTADFGLAVSATATPTAAGSGNGYNSRTTFDWASISVRPPQSSIRENSSISGVLVTGANVHTGVAASTVTQLYIDWVSTYVFTLGYVANNTAYVGETVTFNSGSTIGAAIGFYSDMRNQGGITTLGNFTDLAIAPIPEPAAMTLCGLGGLLGLAGWLRRKK